MNSLFTWSHFLCNLIKPCLLLRTYVSLNTCLFVISLPKDGWTSFHAVCHEGHVQVAELLLQAGASVEKETEVRWDQSVLGCLLDDDFQGKIEDWHWDPSNAVHFQKLLLHISILVLMDNVLLACWHSRFHNNKQPSNQHSFFYIGFFPVLWQ